MSRLITICLIALTLAALMPNGVVYSAKPTPPTPTPPPTPPPTLTENWVGLIPSAAFLQEKNCTLGRDSVGSETLICKPTSAIWPYVAVIYAHGYVNPYFTPKTIPWDQMFFMDGTTQVFLPDVVTKLGYYFATTSYRSHGLVVQDAIQDLLLLRSKVFASIPGIDWFKNAVLAGVSEGGVITALSIERYASSYYAGLAMCGPYGNFQKQVNYWGDFRTLYDAYKITQLPPSAVSIPNTLIENWYGENGSTLKSDTSDVISSKPTKSQELLDSLASMYDPSHPLYDLDVPTSVKDTILGLLDYNIFANNNGQVVLGGNPFGNRRTNYPYSAVLKKDLDTLVTRYSATKSVPSTYETTGNLTKPLVVMHNLGDPIVPYWHVPAYQAKVASKGKLSNFRLQAQVTNYYGHCNFTQGELMAAFNMIGSAASGSVAPLPENLLTGKNLEDYNRIMNDFIESGQFAK